MPGGGRNEALQSSARRAECALQILAFPKLCRVRFAKFIKSTRKSSSISSGDGAARR
jgi:hypothetical protein